MSVPLEWLAAGTFIVNNFITLRVVAYLIVLFLGLGWVERSMASFDLLFFDLGSKDSGGVILMIAGWLNLTPALTLNFAQTLAGLKLLLGIYLFAAVIAGVYDLAKHGRTDDAVLDSILLIAAFAAAIAGLALAQSDIAAVRDYGFELFLCVAASVLAALSRHCQPEPEPAAMPGMGGPLQP
jgi:hypothetical protein